jgi:hypothetical protein
MHLNKKLIGWVVIVVIAGFAVYTLLKSAPDDAAMAEVPSVGTDLLELLNKLKSVSFDTDLFSSPSFTSLVDWTLPLPIPSLGRPNPFEKIGLDIGASLPAPLQASTTTAP